MTPIQTVAHGAEILMHLFGGNTTQGKHLVGEKLTSHLGWGLTCKTEERWVQRLCSLTVKVWSHKFCVHVTQMKYETIIRFVACSDFKEYIILILICKTQRYSVALCIVQSWKNHIII